jgi:hypothetical protein
MKHQQVFDEFIRKAKQERQNKFLKFNENTSCLNPMIIALRDDIRRKALNKIRFDQIRRTLEMKSPKDSRKYKNALDFVGLNWPNWKPNINRIIYHLNKGDIIGIGAKPSSDSHTTTQIISNEYKIRYSNLNIKAYITEKNRLSSQKVASTDINGSYLHYQDGWSTITKMDMLRPIVISGNFSGCAYKVFQAMGLIICAHIARPNGPDAEQNVNYINDYAQQHGWIPIHTILTAGCIGQRGCSEVVVVSQLMRGNQVESIRLEINSLGQTVGKTIYH